MEKITLLTPDAAVLAMTAQKLSDGRVKWWLHCELPGMDPYTATGWADLSSPDELNTWADDFHGESKVWRSMMETCVWHWAEAQGQLL